MVTLPLVTAMLPLSQLSGSRDPKKFKEAEYLLQYLGLKIGVAISLNPSTMPPLDSELKYANMKRGFKIELYEDGYYRWFKPFLR